MDKERYKARLYKLASTVLIRRGFTSREQIAHVFNRGGVIGIDGVGKRLAKLIENALLQPNPEWVRLFPSLPLYEPTSHVELSTVPGARVEWQPAEGLLEGHSLVPPPPTEAG